MGSKTKTTKPLHVEPLHIRVKITIHNPRYLNVGPASALARAVDATLSKTQKAEPGSSVIGKNGEGFATLYTTIGFGSLPGGEKELVRIVKKILNDLEA